MYLVTIVYLPHVCFEHYDLTQPRTIGVIIWPSTMVIIRVIVSVCIWRWSYWTDWFICVMFLWVRYLRRNCGTLRILWMKRRWLLLLNKMLIAIGGICWVVRGSPSWIIVLSESWISWVGSIISIASSIVETLTPFVVTIRMYRARGVGIIVVVAFKSFVIVVIIVVGIVLIRWWRIEVSFSKWRIGGRSESIVGIKVSKIGRTLLLSKVVDKFLKWSWFDCETWNREVSLPKSWHRILYDCESLSIVDFWNGALYFISNVDDAHDTSSVIFYCGTALFNAFRSF